MLFVCSIISKINFVFSMEGRLLFTSHLVLFLSMFIFVSVSYCEDYRDQFAQCSRPFECGIFTNISHPFWGAKRPNYCGLPSFKLDCIDNQYPVIQIKNLKFRVLNINQSQYTMTLARLDLWDDICFPNVDIETTILNYTLFRYLPSVENLIFTYSCQKLPPVELTSSINNFTCTSHGGKTENVYYFLNSSSLINLTQQFTACRDIKVPIFRTSLEKNDDVGGMDKVREALNKGFEVAYDFYKGSCVACERSGGRCGFDFSAYQFLCYCHDTPPDLVCLQHDENLSVWNPKVVIGAITIAGVVISLTCVVICRFKSMKSSITFWSRMRKSDKHLEGLIKSYGHLSVKRYRFSDIKKITKSFEEKLGQGGYGGVYKGKLSDGNLVAVKVLNTSKGNGEEFVNEVASISRTSHINIVTLLGFCLEGTKRALVYEFMPNGSLEKFIYNDNPMKTNSHLEREKLLEIATGIARGLEYLHRGCNTRILHFDIKPHNILLDEDFCPKISDFGLSKVLCERKESIISMMDARGTIGYIAPEVFNRNFGGVSHKSDVYSYGMMILEMVGGRENIKVGVTHTSQIYFPHWIYKHMELGSNLGLHGVVKAEEDEIARKMVLVGLWCIQTNPSDRPSMRKVIEMLEGSLEALQIPPKPFLSSPKSPEESYSTTSLL